MWIYSNLLYPHQRRRYRSFDVSGLCVCVLFLFHKPKVTCLLTVLFLLQDGVMVLSATHRYKKKYVTSLLYKPI